MIKGGGRPGGYYSDSGDRVPSVTQILSRFKDPGGLTHWAFKTGLKQGFRHGKHGEPPPGLYSAKAAEIGSVVHDAAEAFVHGEDPEFVLSAADLTLAQLDKARRSYGAFRDWWDIAKPVITHTEVPMVSERHQFGGTADAIGTLAGKLVVMDWKSSKAVYDDYRIQLATYAYLWEETHGELPESAHILRFGKSDGAFEHHSVPDLEKWWKIFLRFRANYRDMYEAA